MPTVSITKHHVEWLSLIEISGPFLSLTSLGRVFPNELDTVEPDLAAELRSAYQEWVADQTDPAIHRAWIQYVLKTLLGWEDRVLVEGQAIPEPMKYTADEHGGETIRPTYLLHNPHHVDQPRALIIVYPPAQELEKSIPKGAWAASPATRMLSLLHAVGIPLGIVTNGEQWMLINAPKDGTAAYISWYAELWNEERLTLRAFTSLLCARRFFGVADEDTLEAMLRESANDAQEVTDQLGLQVRRAVEILVRRLDHLDQNQDGELLRGVSEARLYEAALTVMMRLVFLFSAEERGLFLLGDPMYDQNYAVSTLRAQLHEAADRSGEEVLGFRSDAWSRLLATFRMVYAGAPHEDLKLPAYGGSLFDPDRFPFLEGRSADSRWDQTPTTPPDVDNRTVLHLLDALQVLQTKGEARRLSFRALDIEQIGHVYEGLLDHKATRASEPILGFSGGLEPEIALSELEAASNLLKFLKEATGRSSESPIKRALSQPPDRERLRRLSIVCKHNALFERVKPYLNLLRDDEFGYPLIIQAGSVYVTAGTERRATGTHYTPKALTEPIVEHTLEPLIYEGPAQGLPRDQWHLKPAPELLAIKVCDMAMGSGAFLVQACRYLGARLVEAWERALSADQSPLPRLTIEGKPPANLPGEILIPDDPNERIVTAQRLIADRCLYGVDKNPLAVEMAKLSLWLVTLAKGRPFTFLDHALKCGDSLLGVSLDQLRYWKLNLKRDADGRIQENEQIFGSVLKPFIDHAIEVRRQLESFTVDDINAQREKARLHHESESTLAYLKSTGDHLLAESMGLGTKSILPDIVARFTTFRNAPHGGMTALQDAHLPPVRELTSQPFHWELEFPEVFLSPLPEGEGLGVRAESGARAGFDAFIGNPPFQGGQHLTGAHGVPYRDYLVNTIAGGQRGSADLCAYFFLRAYRNLRLGGTMGLIATNTIAQGDTREVGLDALVQGGGTIYHALNDQPWVGAAAVVVSVIHLHKGIYGGEKHLDGRRVTQITPLLDDSGTTDKPQRLLANAGKSFQGSIVLGMGFVLEPEEAAALIAKDPRNREVLFPYLNGEDLNSHPEQHPSRWVINFFDWTEEQAMAYPDCYAIVREKVYPERMKQNDRGGKEMWWRFLRSRPELYRTIAPLSRVLVVALTSKYLSFSFVFSQWVYAHACGVIASDASAEFALLQSNFHESWTRQNASTLESRLRYTPSDCFETFPLPESLTSLETIGEQYHETRRQIMLQRQEGLTATYNRFHHPGEKSADIQALRELHIQMDEAVALAYGWGDLALGHGFHETKQGLRFTIQESARREALRRLLALNLARYEAEQSLLAGLPKPKKGKGKPSNSVALEPLDPNAPPPEQLDLWDDGTPKQGRLL